LFIPIHIDENENQGQKLNIVPGVEEIANNFLRNQLVDLENSKPDGGAHQCCRDIGL
jgi:hypothetical protein